MALTTLVGENTTFTVADVGVALGVTVTVPYTPVRSYVAPVTWRVLAPAAGLTTVIFNVAVPVPAVTVDELPAEWLTVAVAHFTVPCVELTASVIAVDPTPAGSVIVKFPALVPVCVDVTFGALVALIVAV